MTPLEIAELALIVALAGQAVAGGIAFERSLRQWGSSNSRRLWLAVACASLLLAVHHGHSLELALRSGLFDLGQALLSGAAGVLYGIAVTGLSRRA